MIISLFENVHYLKKDAIMIKHKYKVHNDGKIDVKRYTYIRLHWKKYKLVKTMIIRQNQLIHF